MNQFKNSAGITCFGKPIKLYGTETGSVDFTLLLPKTISIISLLIII